MQCNIKDQTPQTESIKNWDGRMAVEPKNRKRFKVVGPIYGNVAVDMKELYALSIYHKFTLCQKVQKNDFDFGKECANTKVRWGEQEKIYKKK